MTVAAGRDAPTMPASLLETLNERGQPYYLLHGYELYSVPAALANEERQSTDRNGPTSDLALRHGVAV